MGMLPLQAAKTEFLCANKYEISNFCERVWNKHLFEDGKKKNQALDFVSTGIVIQKFIIYDIFKPPDNICYHFNPHTTIIIKDNLKICDLCSIIYAFYIS